MKKNDEKIKEKKMNYKKKKKMKRRLRGMM